MDRTFVKDQAIEECSNNKRCVGIEYLGEKFGRKFFAACLDSIYTSTFWNKNQKSNTLLLKRLSHGKCARMKQSDT